MKLEHQARVVQLLVEPGKDGKKCRVATGFAVTQSRILTCAHSVRGASSLKVRFLSIDSESWLDADVIWSSRDASERADVAILEVDSEQVRKILLEEGPENVRKALGQKIHPILPYSRPRDTDKWVSQGVLRDATKHDSDGRPIAALSDFGGGLYEPKVDGSMSLDASTSVAVGAGWQGASGSPVFVGKNLVGMVQTWPDSWMPDRLMAVWLGHLWPMRGFAQAIGMQPFADGLARLVDTVSGELARSQAQGLSRDLAQRLKLELDHDDAKTVARHLCALEPAAFMRLVCGAHDAYTGRSGKRGVGTSTPMAEQLEKLVDAILPEIVDTSAYDTQSVAGTGGTLTMIELPCKTTSVAELHMAHLGRRPPRFRAESLGSDDPVGEHCVPNEVFVGHGESSDTGAPGKRQRREDPSSATQQHDNGATSGSCKCRIGRACVGR